MEKADSANPSVFQVTAYRCRCGHEWVPNDLRSGERPRVCPKCKSPNWDRAYQFRRVGGARVEVAKVEA